VFFYFWNVTNVLFLFFTLGTAPGPGLSVWNSGIVSKEEYLCFFSFSERY
jgi:hypothetical protein